MKENTVILKGTWSQGTTWEFVLAPKIPKNLPITATAGLPYVSDNFVLTRTKRGWEIPGGHVEDNETIIECLYREILEEAGMIVHSHKMVGYLHVHNVVPRFSKSTGRQYPEHSYIPHYIVFSNEPLQEPSGDDCFEARPFSLFDEEVQGCDKVDIIRVLHTVFLSAFPETS